MPKKQITGKRGEALAADYLVEQGYTLVAANWRCPHGEIDVIARQGDTLVFVEVRSRRAGTEAAFESISPRKRRILERMAHLYLSANELDLDWRVDVIAVAFAPSHSQPPVIEHVENALDW